MGFGKVLFTSVKGHLCLTKGPFYNLEGQVEIDIIRKKIYNKKKRFFEKGHFLTKHPIPGRFIFLKEALIYLFKFYSK